MARRYAVHLCPDPGEPLVVDPCPGGHTPAPTSYLGWHGWAHEMAKTHKQKRCDVCGKYGIWVPKPPRKPRKPKESQ